MSARQGYAGIDRFRLAAAFLVVAVHTAPLLSAGALPDFLFRTLARVGVPFFFAATGFFLLAPYAAERRRAPAPVWRFLKKTAVLYGIAMVLYLPLNLYAGHFAEVGSVGQALRLVLVDGTLYHLWYLPAAMLGVLVTWGLLRCAGLKAATVAAAALYLAGLLGDSYFGLASAAPPLARAYAWIFTFSSYTRNGLFFAPIFLLVGVFAARSQTIPRAKALLGLCASLLLLLAEALALFFFATQRHDSMYVALPLCTFFLMVWLASFAGPSSKTLRGLSLWVYILHPWAIVAVRGAAKLPGIGFLLHNSAVFYLAVCALSLALAGAVVYCTQCFCRRTARAATPARAWVAVNVDALKHNVRVLQGLLPGGCKLMPVLKANAYGFGAVPIAKALYALGVRDFCVATLAEGIGLRKGGIGGRILILGYTHPDDCRLLARYRLAQTVVDAAHGAALAERCKGLPVHIKVDTGMHRLGEGCEQTDTLYALLCNPRLRVQGIFTQLSASDSRDPQNIAFTNRQLAAFRDALQALAARGAVLPKTHLQASYGILNYPGIRADYARPGLALYGIVDAASCIGPVPDLQPIFTVQARIALVRTVCRGERLGYGRAAVAPGDMRIAVLAMGYADGLPRSLSGGVGQVLLHGRRAPIVGNICMDQTLLDVSGIPDVQPGDTAVVMGRCGRDEISAHTVAAWANTIPNEVVCRLGERLARVTFSSPGT